eukprot:NODE_8214_length_1514_cov_4.385004.p1 GENE.NODE_8214_length_1514_cov_4.385004~~NODE_8214_length_1514_cov_4.385004.p1  ORF type:complete len:345 (+),score=73.34 NODE_8214_length_1514_cov_4.385004:88-1122(+)
MRVLAVNYNVGAAGFGLAPWHFGRVGLAAEHLADAVREASTTTHDLVVVAVEEAWGMPTGVPWAKPFVALQEVLLRRGLFTSAAEPRWMRMLWIFAEVLTALLMPLISLIPACVCSFHDPKVRMAEELSRAGLRYTIGLHGATRKPPPTITAVDSGLMICSSQPADVHGFEPFAAEVSALGLERMTNRGVVWARFGELLVITLHFSGLPEMFKMMGGLRRCFGRIVRRAIEANPESTRVLIMGDFNHSSLSPVPYPNHYPSMNFVLEALDREAPPGWASATLLSGTEITFRPWLGDTAPADVTDHVIGITRAGFAPPTVHSSKVVPDERGDFSDHGVLFVEAKL